MRFIRRSEIVFLTYWTAPGMSRAMSILCRHSFTRFFTNKQLSLRTVSIPVKKKGGQGRNQRICKKTKTKTERSTNRGTPTDTFSVHFVKLVRICPQQTSIPLLANQEIRIVNLFKLQFDWLREPNYQRKQKKNPLQEQSYKKRIIVNFFTPYTPQ